MATSSITKEFVVSGKKQVEKFLNAIEKSYQESLHRKEASNVNITFINGPEEVKKFMAQREKKADD